MKTVRYEKKISGEKKVKKESNQKCERTAKANPDKLVKTQEKEVNSKP